jgi:hypothetical protein
MSVSTGSVTSLLPSLYGAYSSFFLPLRMS